LVSFGKEIKMSDFTSSFWAIYVAVIVLLGILFNLWLLVYNGKARPMAEDNSTGHVWDGDLRELNNSMPRWWVILFIGTLIFAVIYFALFPGFGSYKGLLGWTSTGQFEDEIKAGDAQIAPIYAAFAGKSTQELAKDPQAMAIGDRLFMNNCSQCHGTDAKGAAGNPGFPNLTDADWRWGGTPAAIHETIANGRTGIMPPQAEIVGTPDDVENVANYVMSIGGMAGSDPVKAAKGEAKFKMICAACHGADGKGNQMLGSANLTAPQGWFDGAPSKEHIIAQITNGLNAGDHPTSVMPVWGKKFTPEQINVLTAYVWGKGGGQEPPPPAPAAAAPTANAGAGAGADGAAVAAPAAAAETAAAPAADAAPSANTAPAAGDALIAPTK
jgi:cytochrome c oxidase cbb3-type subunit 3